MEINIRSAKKEDCEKIVEKLFELAKYEKSIEHVRINLEIFTKDGGFNSSKDRKYFQCLVAENENHEIKAYCLFYYTYSTWLGRNIYLEDFYVDESVRRRGIGSKLFKKVVEEALKSDAIIMKLNVLDWNEKAIAFYNKFGGENLTKTENWHNYYLDKSSLLKIASLN